MYTMCCCTRNKSTISVRFLLHRKKNKLISVALLDSIPAHVSSHKFIYKHLISSSFVVLVLLHSFGTRKKVNIGKALAMVYNRLQPILLYDKYLLKDVYVSLLLCI